MGADGEAGFTVDEEGNTIITRPAGVAGGLGVSSTDSTSYTSFAVSKVNMNSAVPLSAREDLVAANIAYESELQQAKEVLNDALEQTSMSTWSCYNVFFSQMAHYFSDVQVANTELAKCLISLKNSQQISKKLTKERRDRLVSMRSTAECQLLQDIFKRDTTANSPPPPTGNTASALQVAKQQQHHHAIPKVSAGGNGADDIDFFGEMFSPTPSKSPAPTIASVVPPPQDEEDEYGDFASSSAQVSLPTAQVSPQQATRPTYVPSDLDNLFGS